MSLVDHSKKSHHRPSTCASAASAWGSQKHDLHQHRGALDGGGELGLGLLPCTISAYDVPRPRWQWAWSGGIAEFAGQGEGLVVMGFGLLNFWRITLYCNLAEEASAYASWPRSWSSWPSLSACSARVCASSMWPAHAPAPPQGRGHATA